MRLVFGFRFSVFILFLMGGVLGFESGEDEEGNFYLESEVGVVVPSLDVGNFFVLRPSSRPSEEVTGMIYFDEDLGRLRFYDGERWRSLVFEGEVSVVMEEEREEVDKKVKSKGSEDIDVEVGSVEGGDSILEELDLEIFVGNESDEVLKEEDIDVEVEAEEVCEEVCEAKEVCEEVESCEEVCETEEEVENCEEVCKTKEVCEEGEEVCEEVCEKPEQLFDIRMDLEDNVLRNSSELFVVVTYESFGRVPTPVDLTYEVFDLDGNLIYSRKGNVTVSTEEVTRTRLDDLVLPEGDYELVFTTLYNIDVEDEFRSGFEVKGKGFFERFWDWINFWRLSGFFGLVVEDKIF